MLTPKQLSQLGDILLQETRTPTPALPVYIGNALRGKPTPLDEIFRISANGRLEAARPAGPKPYPVRLQTRAVIRALTRAAVAGIPISSATKDWMQAALRAADFREEAEKCLRPK